MPVDLRLSRVEEETVAEHLPQIGQERTDAVVLVVVLVVQPLLDHVQGDRVFDLLQVLREVEISAVPEGNFEKGFLDPERLPEGHRLWPQLVHLEQKSSTKLEIPF